LSRERPDKSTELVPAFQPGGLAIGILAFTVPATVADHDDTAGERFFTFFDHHLHVLVRLGPEVARGWSDEEVVRRWGSA
jgi:hypothetical protein